MGYEIVYKPSAEKSFAKLTNDAQKRIFSAVQELAENPRPPGVKKLKAVVDLYRIRVGDYRIVYSIEDKQRKILVLTIGHRRDVYR